MTVTMSKMEHSSPHYVTHLGETELSFLEITQLPLERSSSYQSNMWLVVISRAVFMQIGKEMLTVMYADEYCYIKVRKEMNLT